MEWGSGLVDSHVYMVVVIGVGGRGRRGGNIMCKVSPLSLGIVCFDSIRCYALSKAS